LDDANESMEAPDGDAYESSPVVSGSKGNSPAEYSADVRFPAPPTVSTSSVKFSPLSTLAFAGQLQRTASVKVHLSERLYSCSGVFSPTECQRLISELNFTPKEESLQVQFMNSLKGIPVVRTNMRRKYIDENIAKVMDKIAQQVLPKTLSDGRKYVGIRSQMNFFRYAPGEFFKPHVDGGFISTETGHNSEYTFVIYLNDNFQGGSTRFCGISEWEGGVREVTPVQGSVTLLRQSDMKHCGVVLQSGYKFILQGMVMYGPVSYNKLGRPIPKKANIFTTVDC